MCRAKSFEKGGEYANTWKKDDDGKLDANGPRIVVGGEGAGPQGGFITKYVC